MSWFWLLLACALVYLTKLSGYLLPARWLSGTHVARISALVTVGLLASLISVNTFSQGAGWVVDARLASLLAAAFALWLRAPFLLVVLSGALAAAGLRALGVG